MLPVVLVVFFALWQIALTGYTYVAAGHAAREGARELAVDPSDTGDGPAVPQGAPRTTSRALAQGRARSSKDGDVTVSVKLQGAAC